MIRRGVIVFLLALSFAGGVAGSACAGDSKADAYGESNARSIKDDSVSIEMKDLQFSPQGIKVRPGTSVTWINNDPVIHNVRQVESSFLSQVEMPPGDSFTFRFDKPGTYRYQCTFHHPNMNGVVVVEEK